MFMDRFITRVSRVSDQDKEDDIRATNQAQLLGMMWRLTLDTWVFRREAGAEPRLQRHIVCMQRRES